jgi:glutathione S-transferase
MSIRIYGHAFSSYTQKALVALYENGTAFEFKPLGPESPENFAELKRHWPVAKFPLIEEGGRVVFEASAIIEYLELHHPGPVCLIPRADAGLEARMLDRVFDNYVMAPMQRIVDDALRAPGSKDPLALSGAHAVLDTIYPWLDAHLAGRTWAAGDAFTLADCAAAPALFYADWVHEIPAGCPRLRAYRSRLLARPSFARAVQEARPYRHFFPPGAPDRD